MDFAVRIPGTITSTGFEATVSGNQDILDSVSNQIYIMYIASDYFESFAIYRIEELRKFYGYFSNLR